MSDNHVEPGSSDMFVCFIICIFPKHSVIMHFMWSYPEVNIRWPCLWRKAMEKIYFVTETTNLRHSRHTNLWVGQRVSVRWLSSTSKIIDIFLYVTQCSWYFIWICKFLLVRALLPLKCTDRIIMEWKLFIFIWNFAWYWDMRIG